MSTVQPYIPTEAEKVEDWREWVLIQAGYPPDAAIALARHPDVDLHRAAELLARGCPADIALQIIT